MKYLICSTDNAFIKSYDEFLSKNFSQHVQYFVNNYTYILNEISPSKVAYVVPITSRGILVSHDVLINFPIPHELIDVQIKKYGITTKHTDKKFLPVGSSIYLTLPDNTPIILTVTMYTLQDVSKTPNPVYSLYSSTILAELNEISTIILPALCTNVNGKMKYDELCLQINNSLDDNFQIRPICITPDSKVTFITKHEDTFITQPDIKINKEFRPNLVIRFKKNPKQNNTQTDIQKNNNNKNKNKNIFDELNNSTNKNFINHIVLLSELFEDPTYVPSSTSSCSSTDDEV